MRRTLALFTCAVAFAALVPSQAFGSRPLETAVVDATTLTGPEADTAFARIRAAGATKVRLLLNWPSVAPGGNNKPLGFNARDPGDIQYSWGAFDQEIDLAAAHGLDPLVYISDAPRWAEGSATGRAGTRRPDPVELGKFATAAAKRYSGTFQGHPRVRLWQLWNEPNLISYLSPQTEGGKPASPGIYRAMLYRFAAAVRNVNPSNRVIAGGLAPFTNRRGTAPMTFMRDLLCMSGRAHPQPSCSKHASFDIWSTHPYTSGGPEHHAAGRDDVSIGDLPEMKRLLDAARRAGHIDFSTRPKFWVTEFSWDTKPPDSHGVPLGLHGRWVAEALYRMWKAGVSLVTWFQVRDDANNGHPDNEVFQSGLYFRCSGGLSCDQPKPALTAFRFPFVGLRAGNGVLVWGRTPDSSATRVLIERKTSVGWIRIAKLTPNSHGIFQRHLSTSQTGKLRARAPAVGDTSLPFKLLKKTPDMHVNPFG